MRDILPDEVELRDAAVREIVAVYRAYGFRRIETPALESLRLLAGSDGGENERDRDGQYASRWMKDA